MKNKLIDLNNHLFAQLERLGDESLSDEMLKIEFSRSKAITSVASQVVSNARLAFDKFKYVTKNELTAWQPLPDFNEGINK